MVDTLNGMEKTNNFSSSPEVEVTLNVDMMSVTENSGKEIKYTFTRQSTSNLSEARLDNTNSTNNVDTSSDLIVNFSIAGKAQLDKDYKLTGVMDGTEGKVTIPSGQETATVTITPIADSEIESDEAVKLTLETGDNYIIDSMQKIAETPSIAFMVSDSWQGSGYSTDTTKMAVITNDDPMYDVPWIKKFDGSAYGYEFLAVDDDGNTYVTGDFNQTAKLDDKTITRSNPNSGVFD
ncbi:MAG: Calx-beta domain-containing protein, partial [Cyanobacteria bacterium J06621_15]